MFEVAQTLSIDVAAISTAIQVVGWMPRDTLKYWILVDAPNMGTSPNLNYGPDAGWGYMQDAALQKVIPNSSQKKKDIIASYPNVTGIAYHSSSTFDFRNGRHPFDGKLPVAKGPHLTLPFALQWLVMQGYREIILAGVDLKATVERPRVWGGHLKEKVVKHYNDNHAKLLQTIQKWLPYMLRAGVQLLNWTPGSPLNRLLPWWTPAASQPTPPPDHAQDHLPQLSPA